MLGATDSSQSEVSRSGLSRRFKLAVGLTALVGLVIRAYNVLTVQSGMTISQGDAFLFYWLPAQQLAKGRGYISPQTFQHCTWNVETLPDRFLLDMPDRLYNLCQAVPSAKHPPGFVTLLAILDRLGISSMTAQRYALTVLGCVTVVLVGVLAARLISERAGIIAAIIAAVYPNIWISDTQLYAETLMSFGFVLGLVGVYGFWRSPSWKRLLVASVGFAIATSARSEMIVLFGVVLVPLVFARRLLPIRTRVAWLALAAVAPLLIVIPWSVYNSGRFENSVLLSTGLGPTMLASTCDLVYYTDRIGLYDLRCTHDAPSASPAGVGMDESEVNAYTKREAMKYAKSHPGRTALVVFAREARMLELWNPKQQNIFNHYAQGRGSIALVTTAQWMFRLLALLSIVGAILWRRRRIPLYPLVAEFLLTALVVAITFGSTRYRAAAEWCLILLAATTLDAMIGWFLEKRRRGSAGAGDTRSDDVAGADVPGQTVATVAGTSMETGRGPAGPATPNPC